MPQSKEHQRQEMWQVLVAKETKAFEDVPTGIEYTTDKHVEFNIIIIHYYFSFSYVTRDNILLVMNLPQNF